MTSPVEKAKIILFRVGPDLKKMCDDVAKKNSWQVMTAERDIDVFSLISSFRPELIIGSWKSDDDSLDTFCNLLRNSAHGADVRLATIGNVDEEFPDIDVVMQKKLSPTHFARIVENQVNGCRVKKELKRHRERFSEDGLDDIDEKPSSLSRLKSYLSPTLVEFVLNSNDDEPFGSDAKRKRATFMFLDIRDFTQMTDALEPETVSDIVNEYYAMTDAIISRHRGTINKFLGDGILAVFGDPRTNKDHRLAAIRAALAIKKKVVSFAERVSFLPSEFRIGIGIHAGKAIFGNFGTHSQIDYTAIGPAVNLAARLQGLADHNEIIVSEDTYKKDRDCLEISDERIVQVKGVEEGIKIAEILSVRDQKNVA